MMELPAVLRAWTGGAPEAVVAITVLQLGEAGCLIESSRPLELGDRVAVEVTVAGEKITASGLIMASNELQLLYSVRFDDRPALSPRVRASLPSDGGR